MSKNEKKITGGIAVIGLGFLFMFMLMGMMVGGRLLMADRGHVYSARAVEIAAETTANPEGGTTITTETVKPDFFYDHHGYHRFHSDMGMDGRFPRYGHSSFGLVGGLFWLAIIGLIGILLFGLIRNRGQGEDPGSADPGGARVVNDVENEIRVGDEIGDSPAENTPDPDEMTVDDLLRAMKRLGIKKLEL